MKDHKSSAFIALVILFLSPLLSGCTDELQQERTERPENIVGTTFDSSGRHMCVAWLTDVVKKPESDHSYGSRIDVIDTTNWKVTRSWYADDIPIFSLASSPDGKLLVGASNIGLILVWGVTSGKELATITVDGATKNDSPEKQELFPIDDVVFAANGRYIAARTPKGIQAFDMSDLTKPRSIGVLPGEMPRTVGSKSLFHGTQRTWHRFGKL